METWVIYAIFSLFTAWIVNFWYKIITKRWYNTSYVSFFAYLSAATFAWMYYLYNNFDSLNVMSGYFIILLALWNTFFFFLSTLSRVKALYNVDTTIFFPLYKTFFPILMTATSFLIFNETLELKDLIGIILGICVPLLLITKSENVVQKNLKTGLIFILLTSLFAWIATIFPKIINVKNLDLDFFIFMWLLVWTFFSAVSYKFFDKNSKREYTKKGIFPFAITLWMIQFLGFYAFTYALEWNLAIAVTINSFSILIPIILSVIFYKEEMTKKKAFVIFLSIVSVILFI